MQLGNNLDNVDARVTLMKIKEKATGKILILAECRLCELYKVKGPTQPKGKDDGKKKDKKAKKK